MIPDLKRSLADYGILLVLIALCALFSMLTNTRQQPRGAAAARQVLAEVLAQQPAPKRVLVVCRESADESQLASAIVDGLRNAQLEVLELKGEPPDVRRGLIVLQQQRRAVDIVACSETTAGWSLISELPSVFPELGSPRVVSPRGYYWPTFLTAGNLLNVANQISVIAIVAIGMTMVIIAGGIDLSVGSLIALSAVITGLVIREWGGATQASIGAMILASAVGILTCGFVGLATGIALTRFRVPPFIVTLSAMMMVSGIASKLTNNESVYQIPDSFVWLGRGTTGGLPNTVIFMLVLYLAAWFVMTRTSLGRYLYAVGGNMAAARLSGVPVKRVVVSAYVVSALLAGLGGVIMTSYLKSASPSYGAMYEMYVIAAVVVGGTSLSGGEGKMLGTLLGALVIAVISNGMNLLNVESNMQRVVLGLLILGAVLMDCLQRYGWRQRVDR